MRDAMHLPKEDLHQTFQSSDIPLETILIPTTKPPSSDKNSEASTTRHDDHFPFLQSTSNEIKLRREKYDLPSSPINCTRKSQMSPDDSRVNILESLPRAKPTVNGVNCTLARFKAPSSCPRPDKVTNRVEAALARSTDLPVHHIRELRKNRSDPSRNRSKFITTTIETGRRTSSIPTRRSFASSCTSSFTDEEEDSVNHDRRKNLDLIDDEYNHIANMMIALDRSPK